MKFKKFILTTILLPTILSLTFLSSSVTGQDTEQAETDRDIPVVVSQDMQQIMFLSELDGKKTATYGDALRMFRFKTTGSGAYSLKGYSEYSKLTRGMVSLMTARYLKLNDSLMYRIFENERYAYKACMAEKLFSKDGSEHDVMTGPELIELFGKISKYKGRR